MLAFALAVVLAIGSILSLVESCSEEVVSTEAGNHEVVKTCGAVNPSDGPFLAVILVIGVLLLPDISELSIASLISLRRRVDATESSLALTTSNQGALSDRITRSKFGVVYRSLNVERNKFGSPSTPGIALDSLTLDYSSYGKDPK